MAEPFECRTATLGGMLRAMGIGLIAAGGLIALAYFADLPWLMLLALPMLFLAVFAAARHSRFEFTADGLAVSHERAHRWARLAVSEREFIPYDSVVRARASRAMGRYPSELVFFTNDRRAYRITDDRLQDKLAPWERFVRNFAMRTRLAVEPDGPSVTRDEVQ